jgi:two-component system response regulator YesN
MYKIIVADDEDDVRKGIIDSVPWEELGFIVAGEAENGKEALELCEREMPDLLIADINMPYISGLELLELLDRKRPRPLVVFLTAYDEFEYAQKAVSLKASEYILKPITGDELAELLKKLKSSMDEETAKREDIKILRGEFERNLPLLREKFISLLINGKLSPEEIAQKIKAYGMQTLKGKACLAGVVMADEEKDGVKDGFDRIENKELIQFALYNIASEIMDTHERGITFLYGDNVILISLGDDEESLITESISVFCEICQSVKKYLKFTVTIGAGYCCGRIEHIGHSYNSAVTACNYKMLLGGGRVIYIADIEPHGPQRVSPETHAVQNLVSGIRAASLTEANIQIDKIFADAARGFFSPDVYVPYIFEVVTAILRTATVLGVNTQSLLGQEIGRFIYLLGSPNLSEMKQWVSQTCEMVIREINSSRKNFKKKLIIDSLQYVSEHYTDPETSIETVCKYIHISPSYFCSIFKKEMSDTFNNYLHLFRMQAAKELLRTTDLKLCEVAERIGYSDPNYFSFSFKKTFGMSPREYRLM